MSVCGGVSGWVQCLDNASRHAARLRVHYSVSVRVERCSEGARSEVNVDYCNIILYDHKREIEETIALMLCDFLKVMCLHILPRLIRF